MKLCPLLLVAISMECSFASEGPATASSQSVATPGDTVVLTLPGAARRPAVPKEPAPRPAAPAEHPKADLPDAFKADSTLYLQQLIGKWKRADAVALLGEPTRQRLAYDDKKAVTGKIYAFGDPSTRFREFELDFDSDSGALQSVFAYPKVMTWQDCRQLWGGNVSITHTKNGRTFYSYLNRKLDVLVDGGGKVISLGLY